MRGATRISLSAYGGQENDRGASKGGIRCIPRACMHTIYLGSPKGLPFTPREVALLRSIVAERFVSFTLINAVGVWLGKEVATKQINIASDHKGSVIQVCASLCEAFDQDAVGPDMDGQLTQIKARAGRAGIARCVRRQTPRLR